MANAENWVLPSGRVVEDVLASWVALLPPGTHPYASLHILDVDDPETSSQFTAQEWKHILSQLHPIPLLSDDMISYITQFGAVSYHTEPLLLPRAKNPDPKYQCPTSVSGIHAIATAWRALFECSTCGFSMGSLSLDFSVRE